MATVSDDVYAQLQQIGAKLDILNESVYNGNVYQQYNTGSIMLMTCLLLFLVGFLVARGRR